MTKKNEKKKAKLIEQINALESSLRNSLGKKESKSTEINVPVVTQRINKLKQELVQLG